jgi:protein gp37
LATDRLDKPHHWRSPRRVFVCDQTDLFGEWVPDDWLDAIFAVMRATPHTYQVLTKRPSHMHHYLSRQPWWPLSNVWVGTSIELERYVWRAAVLTQLPGPVRFVSAEPLLGPLNLGPYLARGHGIQWVIAGGESGPRYRPFDADWARGLRDQCQRAGVAFHFKQHGGRTHAAGGRLLDDREWLEFPEEAA